MPPETREVPADESLRHHGGIHLYKLPQQTELEIWNAIASQAEFAQKHEFQLAMLLRRQWIWGALAIVQVLLSGLILLK